MNTTLVAYLAAAIILLALAMVFWSGNERRALLQYRPARSAVPLALALVAVGAVLWSVWLEQPSPDFERREQPIAIVIAIDLSPSMLAIPDPATVPNMLPRYQRGVSLLLELIRSLEERDQPVIVSVVGFTEKADIIMGWDEDTTQIRETLTYAASPTLFDNFGTSLEAAAVAVKHAFGLLPTDLADARRVLIVVSDGEDTMYASSLTYALEIFAELGAEIVVLQTGLLDFNEGIPVYDSFGQFDGFHRIGDMLYTVPDAAALRELATSSERAIYLRAENTDAAARLIPAVMGPSTPEIGLDRKSQSILLIFLTVTALTGWLLR